MKKMILVISVLSSFLILGLSLYPKKARCYTCDAAGNSCMSNFDCTLGCECWRGICVEKE